MKFDEAEWHGIIAKCSQTVVALYQSKANAFEMFERDLRYVLTEKTEGEALLKLESSNVYTGSECTRPGIGGYMRLHFWYTKTTNLGKTVRYARIMQPKQAPNEASVAEYIEKWERERAEVEKTGTPMEAPYLSLIHI